ncbi:MAG: elongation factor [Bacteroidota bacterium]|jgi:elongation factor P|nr:elongation factor P [Bacteroidota bacterium]NBU03610.1 elongation factor P [Bacteroidota bacterium]NBX63599.1 elongation factor P [Bacteroidota bacterium]
MATTQDVSVGNFLRYNGELVQVIEWQHRTPGNLRAFYQGKMRRVKDGKLAENRFRSGESVEIVRVETKELAYLYAEGEAFICMDNETYDQVPIAKFMFGEGAKFMKEGDTVLVAFEGETPVSAEPPSHAVVEITYTEPGMKGDTATNTLKPATTETGANVMVPLFVNTGEKIRVDTRTGSYVERVK